MRKPEVMVVAVSMFLSSRFLQMEALNGLKPTEVLPPIKRLL
jgi:hypothetical protein